MYISTMHYVMEAAAEAGCETRQEEGGGVEASRRVACRTPSVVTGNVEVAVI